MLRNHNGSSYTVWSRGGAEKQDDLRMWNEEVRHVRPTSVSQAEEKTNGTEARGRVSLKKWPNFSLWREPEV